MSVEVTPELLYYLAERYIGTAEVPGRDDNPQILAMLTLDQKWPEGDEVPWCSGFVNYVAWLVRAPRSKSLLARSWLGVGYAVDRPEQGDVVVLKRGEGDQPGPDDLTAPGHVGFYVGKGGFGPRVDDGWIEILGGNQSNQVSVQRYPADRVLSVRRIV